MSDLPEPFVYAKSAHNYRHGPLGYADYKDYKPWLRDEFTFRCVYCLERETWYPSRAGAFSTDHFEPVAVAADRARDYFNLVYACLRCNSIKQACTSLPDPRSGLGKDITVDNEGTITGESRAGRIMIEFLHLDSFPAAEVRREVLLIRRAKERYPDDNEIHELYLMRFGYPADLPDLRSRRPPAGNSIEGSEEKSYFVLRERNELPQVY